MSKRYIVAVGSSSVAQADAVVELINKNKFSWWHWIDGFWLLIDHKEESSAALVREEFDKIFPAGHKLVIELNSNGEGWSGFGPKGEDKNMFTWLEENWK